MYRFKNIIYLGLAIFSMLSCSKNDSVVSSKAIIERGGIFIVNEGNFSAANSSLSHYNPITSSVDNNLFYKVNNVPLGDVAQSITINGDLIYLVINNSGIIYAANSETLEFEGKINNLTSPREIIFINDEKAYVSDLYSSAITIINPQLFEITGNIELGKSSECMVIIDDKVLVTNWSAYNQTTINNTVMVINSKTDILIDSVVVGIEPNSMVIDVDNNLWVLCSGGFLSEEMPSLWKIDPNTLEVTKQFSFSSITQNPDNLCINGSGDSLFYLNGGVWGMSIYDEQLPDNQLINEDLRNYYSLGVHPINGEIYLSDALDYNQNGLIYRYSSDGSYISSFMTGIIPGFFAFN